MDFVELENRLNVIGKGLEQKGTSDKNHCKIIVADGQTLKTDVGRDGKWAPFSAIIFEKKSSVTGLKISRQISCFLSNWEQLQMPKSHSDWQIYLSADANYVYFNKGNGNNIAMNYFGNVIPLAVWALAIRKGAGPESCQPEDVLGPASKYSVLQFQGKPYYVWEFAQYNFTKPRDITVLDLETPVPLHLISPNAVNRQHVFELSFKQLSKSSVTNERGSTLDLQLLAPLGHEYQIPLKELKLTDERGTAIIPLNRNLVVPQRLDLDAQVKEIENFLARATKK